MSLTEATVPTTIILLVDNDKDFLESRCEFFQRARYTVKTAHGPAEAKRVLDREHVDLIVLDLRLLNDDDEKDASGLEFARRVAPHLPKIIVTGFPTYQAVREALGPQIVGMPPAVGFVAKQEGPAVLLTAVQKALANRQRVMPDPRVVRRFLEAHFDLEELRTLCFDLGIDFDGLKGDGKTAKVRELVAYYGRRKRLEQLVAAIERERGEII